MKNLLKNEKAVKAIGVTVTLIGFGITMIQKQLDNKKLEDLVAEEVDRRLSEYDETDEE